MNQRLVAHIFMNMKRNLLVLVISIVLLIFTFFLADHVLSLVAKKTQVSGARHAIAGAIQIEVEKTNSTVAILIYEMLGTNETIELNANQYDAIIDILVSQKRQLDAPPPWKPGIALNDPWGNRFRIIVQQIDSNQPPIITVTNHPNK